MTLPLPSLRKQKPSGVPGLQAPLSLRSPGDRRGPPPPCRTPPTPSSRRICSSGHPPLLSTVARVLRSLLGHPSCPLTADTAHEPTGDSRPSLGSLGSRSPALPPALSLTGPSSYPEMQRPGLDPLTPVSPQAAPLQMPPATPSRRRLHVDAPPPSRPIQTALVAIHTEPKAKENQSHEQQPQHPTPPPSPQVPSEYTNMRRPFTQVPVGTRILAHPTARGVRIRFISKPRRLAFKIRLRWDQRRPCRRPAPSQQQQGPDKAAFSSPVPPRSVPTPWSDSPAAACGTCKRTAGRASSVQAPPSLPITLEHNPKPLPTPALPPSPQPPLPGTCLALLSLSRPHPTPDETQASAQPHGPSSSRRAAASPLPPPPDNFPALLSLFLALTGTSHIISGCLLAEWDSLQTRILSPRKPRAQKRLSPCTQQALEGVRGRSAAVPAPPPAWTRDTEMLPPTLKPWFAAGFKFKKLHLEQSHLWIPSLLLYVIRALHS